VILLLLLLLLLLMMMMLSHMMQVFDWFLPHVAVHSEVCATTLFVALCVTLH